MFDPSQHFRSPRRIGLFVKMALVLTPVFVAVAACGLLFLTTHTTSQADNALSARLGNATARVSAALERHAKTDQSADAWATALPAELLNTLLSDQAIRCVTFTRADATQTKLTVPRGLGCVGQEIDARFSIPFSTTVPSKLEVGYDRSEVRSLRSTWLSLSALALGLGWLLSLGAAWIGFHFFISKPLRRLRGAIAANDESTVPTTVAVSQNDELGSVMVAFNAMQMKDKEKTDLIEHGRARLSHVLNSMMDGLLVVGQDTRVIMANSASSKLLGLPVDNIVGASVFTLFRSTQLSTDGTPDLASVEAISADQKWVPVKISSAPMNLNHETANVFVFRDISDDIEHEQAIRKKTLEALTANRTKTEFLANMSHELRTPLNAILGFSEIIVSEMMGGPRNTSNIDSAKDINDSGQHLLDLINDILDIAKVEAGEVKFNIEPVSLQKLFTSVERVMRPRAMEGSIRFEVSNLSDHFYLCADNLRLKQILINLVSNAIKFTPEGGTVSLEAQQENGNVKITVRDNGIGMSASELEEAMKPFRQVDNSHTRRYEGTGLGLPLSNNLVNLQGGTLKISSATGRGTEVSVTLPQGDVSSSSLLGHENYIISVAS